MIRTATYFHATDAESAPPFTLQLLDGEVPRPVLVIGDEAYRLTLVQTHYLRDDEWKARALAAERNELEMATTLSKAIGRLAGMQAELDNAHAIIDERDQEAARIRLERQADELVLMPAMEPRELGRVA